ncbi:MAG: thiamine phosphate synthase [Rectinemataceae bacterium]
MDYSLYLVTDSSLSRGRSSLEVVDAAIRGGVTMVQYREKGATTRAMIEEARVLLELCRSRGVPFIVNDRADVALAVDADGLHVGQDDMPASLARRIIGNGRILGVSAGNIEEALRAAEDGADYIGASPVFSTPTKPDALRPMGPEGLRALSRAVALPVVAIGGINAGSAAAVLGAGAAGLAVVSAIVSAENVEAAARALRKIIDGTRG